MTEALEKQIKIAKRAFIPGLIGFLLFAFPIIAICFVLSEEKLLQAMVCIAFFAIFFGFYFAVFLKRFSVYRKLKTTLGKETETIEIECADVHISVNPTGIRIRNIIGVKIIAADKQKYFFPMPERLTEYNETFSKTFYAGTDFFKTKLKGKRLHLKFYRGTNLINEIKEFPNYEIAKINQNSLVTK